MAINTINSSNSENSLKVVDEYIKYIKRTHIVADRVGDSHYDTISALHKSVRGCDPDANCISQTMLESRRRSIICSEKNDTNG